MKNQQRGFVVPLILIIIAVLAVGGAIYYAQNKKSAVRLNPEVSQQKNNFTTSTVVVSGTPTTTTDKSDGSKGVLIKENGSAAVDSIAKEGAPQEVTFLHFVETLPREYFKEPFGVTMEGGVAYRNVESCCGNGDVSMPSLNPPTLPDIDLHMYSDSGVHLVGLNYGTNKFEDSIANDESFVSGDQFNGQEWILLPTLSSTTTVHFIVSDIKAAEFLATSLNSLPILGDYDTFKTNVIAYPHGIWTKGATFSGKVRTGGAVEILPAVVRNANGAVSLIVKLAAVTPSSLRAELDEYNEIGGFKNQDEYRALSTILLQAKEAADSNDYKLAIKKIGAFQSQLKVALVMDGLIVRQAMLKDSQDLIGRLTTLSRTK